jgi:CheY-like chemotaxis protein
MGSAQSKHILIIEDSADLQSLLSQLLVSEGYAVTQAFDGDEALKHLRSGKPLPSLILLDVMMPVMDGFQFRDEQERDPLLAGIPVLAMSADASSQPKLLVQGVTNFIRKPITDIERLLETVERLSVPV